MLVIYTLRSTISRQLPPTAYTKFIDVWLLFGQFMPFIILLIIVLIEHLPEDSTVTVAFLFFLFQINSLLIKVIRVSNGGKDNEQPPRQKKSTRDFISKFARVFLPLFQLMFVVGYSVVATKLYLK